jgi:Arc/MetJ family transcription regulator
MLKYSQHPLLFIKQTLEPSMIFIRPSLRVTIADYEKAKRDLTYRMMWVSIAMDIAIQWKRRGIMKTVQMTLDENLIASVDKVAKRLGTTRSAFTRQALRTALREVRMNELERKHREGYKRKPVRPGEFEDWEAEQVWVEP